MIKRNKNQQGTRARRTDLTSATDNTSSGSEIDSSGRKVRVVKSTAKAPKKVETRGQLAATGEKRPRSQSETRDSTREPARGRAEFTGSLNKRINSGGQRIVRTTRTASKGK